MAAFPHDSVFHCNLAATYAHLEKYDEAKAEYTRALELNIANVDALVGRSELFLREGNVPKALEDIQTALKLDPEAKRENTKRARATLTMLQKAEATSESRRRPAGGGYRRLYTAASAEPQSVFITFIFWKTSSGEASVCPAMTTLAPGLSSSSLWVSFPISSGP